MIQDWISTIGASGLRKGSGVTFYLVDNNMLMICTKLGFRFCIAALDYNRGTPSSGSADPLWGVMKVRSLSGTGWGPRGGSGSPGVRVRATHPAISSLLPLALQ